MSMILDTDRIKESYRKRRRSLLILTYTAVAMTPLMFLPRPAPGHVSLVGPGAFLLFVAATLLGNWIWRCPACQARLPRGWDFPQYCPQCAVPLEHPSPRRKGFTMAQKLSACVLGPMLILLIPLLGGFGPPQRYHASGRRAARTAIARPTEADIAALRRQMLLANYFLGQRFAGARLRGTNADLALLQRLLDDRRPGADRETMLRCIGAAFGNVLSQDPDFGWVILDDGAGPELGLQSRSASLVVFSLGMIAKRMQDGEAVDLRKLYTSIHAQVEQRGGGPV